MNRIYCIVLVSPLLYVPYSLQVLRLFLSSRVRVFVFSFRSLDLLCPDETRVTVPQQLGCREAFFVILPPSSSLLVGFPC